MSTDQLVSAVSLRRFCHDIPVSLFSRTDLRCEYALVLIFAQGTAFSARPSYIKSITMLRATYTPSPGFRTALDDFRDFVSRTHKVKLGKKSRSPLTIISHKH